MLHMSCVTYVEQHVYLSYGYLYDNLGICCCNLFSNYKGKSHGKYGRTQVRHIQIELNSNILCTC